MRIGIVNDMALAREALKRVVLAIPGHEVAWMAGDGVEALERLASRAFDVVVTDLEMPRLDGLSLIQRLRADARHADCPIVVVSTRSAGAEQEVALAAGANAYIAKESFDQTAFVAIVRRLIGVRGNQGA